MDKKRPNMKMTHFVFGGAKGCSGVGTFVRLVEQDWRLRLGCETVYLLPKARSSARRDAERSPGKAAPASSVGRKAFQTGRLVAGYVRELAANVGRVWRFVRFTGRDLVVVNRFGCETLPIAVRLAAPATRLVAIAHTHPGHDSGADVWVRRLVEWLCLKSVSHVVFNSSASEAVWRKRLGGRPFKSTVIAHGIPKPSPSVPSDYPPKPTPDTVDFLCVSRFVGWKGHAELIEAWGDAVRRTRSPIRLLLVGEGSTRQSVETQVKDLGIRDSVLFLGDKPEGGAYFSGSDVGVLSSIEPEAFGLVLLEAMSRARPMLATFIGAIPEIVEDGVSGLLVPVSDRDAMARAILSLADDSSLRARLGQAAKERWAAHYSMDSMLSAYEQFFRKHMVSS